MGLALPFLSPILALGQAVFGGRPRANPTALPTATRDDAAAMVSSSDELRRRKGGAADILNGTSGTEAAVTGGKLVLGS